MSIKIKYRKGDYKLFMDYDKYQKFGDLHWQWYDKNTDGYRDLVTDTLAPFALEQPGTLVDIGAGDGLPLSILEKMGYKCKGVEPDETGAKIAAWEKNLKAEMFIEKAETFLEREMEFDYLYSLNTIEHLDDPFAMVQLMRKIKKFGIIATDNINVVPPTKRSIYHNIEFNPDSFEELFKEFNLIRLPIRHPNYFAYKISPK